MNSSAISDHQTGFAIAVMGMSGRFPGARDIDEFWQNLRDGRESIAFFSNEELASSDIDPAVLSDPNYVKARGVLEDVELFDASFFGFSPREAEIMDPQHRLFLECAWEALENAGYDPEKYDGSIGVYAGASLNTYLLNNLYSNHDLIRSGAGLQITIGNDKDFLTTRVSYKLNLGGPSVVIQTACSTSLVAIHLACQNLLGGECDIALAGGVSLRVPQKAGYFYQEGGIASPDGHCRAFDARAQGTVSGNGVGIVVLKRLQDALADGDCIHAVIKGSAINNDGALKVGFTAPSVDAQARVIARALAMAEIDPETVGYIEAHGTGTALGDPIEIAALTQAFRASTDKKGFCAIGSVKTNIGHLDVAAGVAGLIKTVLALKHRELPSSLHFKQPNPQIAFVNSPFYVNTTLSEWRAGKTPRRAGVSSFGMGGTNAHVVLEEPPPREASGASRPFKLLVLSAKTPSALERTTANLVKHFKQHPNLNPADVAYTLQIGRKGFSHRRMVVCRDLGDAVTALETLDPQSVLTHFQEPRERPVVFMFPGQGAQYVHMGFDLYQVEPMFREQVNHCSELLQPYLKIDLRDVLYPREEGSEAATHHLQQTSITQPALFVIEYALAKLWMAWGVHPQAMIGHSIGEYVAACLAEVFSLEDALALVAARGRLMQSLPAGAMLAVPLPQNEVESLLGERLSLAAINGPSLCLVSGHTDAVEDLESQLTKKGMDCHRLHISHAFHSEMMEPILAPFTARVNTVCLRPSQIPYVSNVTGTWITPAEATSSSYWARHLRHTVHFAAGLGELLQIPECILLEVGPGCTLGTLAKQHPGTVPGKVVLASLRHPLDPLSDIAFLLNTLGQLWLSGVRVTWPSLYTHERRHRLPLPTYPFERVRYWVAPHLGNSTAASHHALLRKRPDIADWFYVPSWKRFAPISPPSARLTEQKLHWLVFTDTCGLGTQLWQRLEQLGQEVCTVAPGVQFTQLDPHAYIINPRAPEDYETLLGILHRQGKLPHLIVHLWGVGPHDESPLTLERLEKAQELGLFSLLFLAQALGKRPINTAVHIAVVSNNMQEVLGDDLLYPEKATVLGPVKIIAQEYLNISCQSIDIDLPKAETRDNQSFIDQILTECVTPVSTPVIAYRGRYRWEQTIEPVRLSEEINGTPRLKEGGVYLITGGLGGVGLALAEYLAKTVRAKLVLLGRSAFPPRDVWVPWLATHAEDDDVSDKIRKIQELESTGAEVMVASADVANVRQMQEVLTRVEMHFGPINGVIHGAGVVDYAGVIHRRSRQETECILAPKVSGTLILDSLLRHQKLDFFILCSSLGSILYKTQFGEVGYCAANDFLDAFASYRNSREGQWTLSINWTAWQEVGMAVRARQYRASTHDVPDTRAILLEALHFSKDRGLLPSEGVEVFRCLLAHSSPRLAVSTQDLRLLLERHTAFTMSDLLGTMESTRMSQPSHPRPALHQAYVAPRNKCEQGITEIWQKLLGIELIGIHDNFFELGGHSLLAVQIISRLRQTFQMELPLRSMFEAPTVAKLAAHLETILWATQGLQSVPSVARDECEEGEV